MFKKIIIFIHDQLLSRWTNYLADWMSEIVKKKIQSKAIYSSDFNEYKLLFFPLHNSPKHPKYCGHNWEARANGFLGIFIDLNNEWVIQMVVY